MSRAAQPIIFVVDDDDMVRSALVRLLRGRDYAPIAFTNAVEALDRVAELSPALIISDNEMPRMLGLDFLTKVREAWPDVPVMMLTGGSSGAQVHEARASGRIDALIKKPWNNEALCDTVRQLLARVTQSTSSP